MQTRLHAEIAHASNATMSLRAFAFAFVCEYCSRSTACAYVRAHALTYVYIYTVRSRACSGSSGTTMASRFQPNRIFCSRTHRRTAGSAPAPARLRAPCAPSHRSRSARAPRSESPLARSTSYASLDRSFARIVCAYINI